MTRDDFVFKLGQFGSMLTALAGVAGLFPDDWKLYIVAASTIIGTVCGILGHSPLPGAPK